MKARIPCVCPPKANGDARHQADTIVFRDRLDFRAGLAIRKQIALEQQDDPDMFAGETLALLTESYLVFGIESWTLTDKQGKAVPVSRPAIRTLLAEHPEEAMEAGNVADDAYQEQVLLPLLRRGSTSSQESQTPELTSAQQETSSSPSRSRKQSKPSLTSITPTDDIETTMSLPVGGSKSSQNSATVA